MKACCAIGLNLLSLNHDFTYKIVSDALTGIESFVALILKNNFCVLKAGGVEPGVFWTSGSDVGSEGKFGYCASNRRVMSEAK
jgi:hypothetical protein